MKPRGPYRKSSQRRAQIIESAIQLFARRGVDGSSLRTIAEAIGVSHAALRHYFASRDELLVEVYRTHEAQMDYAALDDQHGPVEVMEIGAQRNRAIPGLVQLYATLTTDALQSQHEHTREYVSERFESLRAELAQSVVAGQRAGKIDPRIDPLDAAALVIAASDGLQVQWLLAPEAVDVSRGLELLRRILPGA